MNTGLTIEVQLVNDFQFPRVISIPHYQLQSLPNSLNRKNMALSPTVPFDYSRTKEHDVSCIIIDGAFVDVSNVYVVAYALVHCVAITAWFTWWCASSVRSVRDVKYVLFVKNHFKYHKLVSIFR